MFVPAGGGGGADTAEGPSDVPSVAFFSLFSSSVNNTAPLRVTPPSAESSEGTNRTDFLRSDADIIIICCDEEWFNLFALSEVLVSSSVTSLDRRRLRPSPRAVNNASPLAPVSNASPLTPGPVEGYDDSSSSSSESFSLSDDEEEEDEEEEDDEGLSKLLSSSLLEELLEELEAEEELDDPDTDSANGSSLLPLGLPGRRGGE